MYGFRCNKPIALYLKVDDFLLLKYLVQKTYWNQQVRGITQTNVIFVMELYIC